VECGLTLRYLTQEPSKRDERTMKFITYIKIDKAYWMYQALQSPPDDEMQRKIFEHAKQLGIEPDATSASKHWSGLRAFAWDTFKLEHPLDLPTNDIETKERSERGKKQWYAVEYKHPSSFVHCLETAIDNYIPEEASPFRVAMSSGKTVQPSQSTLFILLSHLHCTIAYALFGMNVDRPAALNALFSETLNSMKPFKRLHS